MTDTTFSLAAVLGIVLRASALSCECQYCAQLASFLANPRESRWVFSAAEARRCHVEHTIRASACDVDCATLRKGRPYSLVCTKNEASYQRRLQQRASDQELARQLELAAPASA